MQINLKVVQRVRYPKKNGANRTVHIDEMYDNTKQFARELNELPMTSKDNQDNIMLQDIITKMK